MSDFKPFTPRARLILQLGDQLIKNESIALLELVKNSYDADASEVSVIMQNIETPKDGKIIIKDNGEGMSREIVESVWLEPGSDYKEKLFLKNVRSKKFKRLPIGEKGIGRFGVHKLGKRIEMISRRENQKEVVVKVNWEDFTNDKSLEEALIEIEERTPLVFTGNKTGTEIIISDLQNEWKRGLVRNVYKSLLALNSPFEAIDSFKVKIELDESKKEWLEGLLEFEDIKNYSLYHFECTLERDEIVDFLYQFTPWKQLDKVKTREITEKDSYIKESKNIILNKEKIDLSQYNIGKIRITGHIFTLDSDLLQMAFSSGKEELRNYLSENGGVRIYRDNLRINEYGEQGNDWLGLDIRRVNVPGIKISNNLILGAIYLNREESFSLIEKTNREGFVENDAFTAFKKSILYVLSLVEKLRAIDKDILNENYKFTTMAEPVITSIQLLRSRINKKIVDKEIKKELEDLIDKIQKDFEETSEILLASAESGLSLGIVLHEVEKIILEMSRVLEEQKGPQRLMKLADHLSHLIKGYGDILRQSTASDHSLKALIKGALFNMEYRLENHDIHIYKEYEKITKDDRIHCSKRLILGAIMNIIDNSIYWLHDKSVRLKAIEEFEKKIFINIIDDGDKVKLLIADNGKGFTIAPAQAIKPFISKKDNGMGLGLHITNEVMKVHKGSLEFPEYGDYSLPEDFKSGAKIALVFNKNAK